MDFSRCNFHGVFNRMAINGGNKDSITAQQCKKAGK